MQQHGEALPFNPFHRMEVRNAIRLAVFKEDIDSFVCKTQLKQIEADLRDETLLIHVPVDWVTVLRQAEYLGATHNESVGCRSSDLFHIAVAVEWEVEHFLTFDERQKKMAKLAGLSLGI